MKSLLSDVLYTHQEGGWHIKKQRAMDLFPAKEFRDCRKVQEIVEPLGEVFVLVGRDGGPMRTWPAGHFGTYLGCTPKRVYANPYVESLYWWHELFHRHTWLSKRGKQRPPALDGEHETWHQWLQRMIDSELDASFASECAIYFWIEGLRDKTFGFPIWIDRYRDDSKHCPPKQRLVPRKMDVATRLEKAYRHRRRILQQGARSHRDWIEYAVSGYYLTNMKWVQMWAAENVGFGKYKDVPAFRCVEDHWPEANDPEAHVAWLRDITPTREEMCALKLGVEYQVPMGRLAERFKKKVFGPYLKEFGNNLFGK